MHQLGMRSFKLFLKLTTTTSYSHAQGFFNPLLCPKILPSYLPSPPSWSPPFLTYPPSYLAHHISHALHLENSIELLSLSHTNLHKEGGELNVAKMWRAEGMWKGEGPVKFLSFSHTKLCEFPSFNYTKLCELMSFNCTEVRKFLSLNQT
jgi:hypothetical protein